MTIQRTGVSPVSVGKLLKDKLKIPPYQRPYSWIPAMALQLVDDLMDAKTKRTHIPYVLGAVILHECDGTMNVVDGQQRILTLHMILAILRPNELFTADEKNETPVIKVWRELKRKLVRLGDNEKGALREFITDQYQVVRVVTNDEDEAFRVFDSQNYRGKPLAPHDLLKAHHLREMQDESAAMKIALVEAWESVPDTDLDRLFSTFLYRIARWSRGESAPGFSTDDIGMFKGISSKAENQSPSERYHLAAQATVPLMNAWASHAGADAERSRFQLDAPLVAGRSFFEMVSFLLMELKTLEGGTENFLGEFGASKNRYRYYRYVYELFIAALLYYTNKFGNQELSEARERLFAWAYTLRVNLLSVHFSSVDKLARGKSDSSQSAFIALRNAMKGRIIRDLKFTLNQPNKEHEKELMTRIKSFSANEQ